MQVPFLDLYRRLIRIRLVEEIIVREYPSQQMRCPVHICLGQEAVSAGALATLTKNDAILATHRSHGPYVAANGDLVAMFSELYGKENGCCGGRGGSMHLVDMNVGFFGSIPIVASTLPIATGIAFGFTMQKKDFVSMAIFGEGATEAGAFHESLQYAMLKQLPIIYVCENNKFAVNTPYEDRRPKDFKIYELAKTHGLATYHGDGNDVFEVYKACSGAVKRAKQGGGPSFLEFETYRWLEHCGPNDDHHLACRSEEDYVHWKKRCPVVLAQIGLVKLGVTMVALDRIYHEEEKKIESALQEAQTAPFPSPQTASSKVYA